MKTVTIKVMLDEVEHNYYKAAKKIGFTGSYFFRYGIVTFPFENSIFENEPQEIKDKFWKEYERLSAVKDAL